MNNSGNSSSGSNQPKAPLGTEKTTTQRVSDGSTTEHGNEGTNSFQRPSFAERLGKLGAGQTITPVIRPVTPGSGVNFGTPLRQPSMTRPESSVPTNPSTVAQEPLRTLFKGISGGQHDIQSVASDTKAVVGTTLGDTGFTDGRGHAIIDITIGSDEGEVSVQALQEVTNNLKAPLEGSNNDNNGVGNNQSPLSAEITSQHPDMNSAPSATPVENISPNATTVVSPATNKGGLMVTAMQDSHLKTLLVKAKVSNQVLIKLFSSKPTYSNAVTFLERDGLTETEIIQIWQAGKSVIDDAGKVQDFWEEAAKKMNFNRINPETLRILCSEIRADALWVQAIKTRKFDGPTYLAMLQEAKYTSVVFEAVLVEGLLEVEDIIEDCKNTKSSYLIEQLGVSVYSYLSLHEKRKMGAGEWHTTLINLAIMLDSPRFWDTVTTDISESE